MKVYIVTKVHHGEEASEVYGDLIPDIFRDYYDAVKFCKEECEAMDHGMIFDKKTNTVLVLDEYRKWYKDKVNIDEKTLYDNEFAFYIDSVDIIQNSWLIDM